MKHHLLLNALANELEDIGVQVTHLARKDMLEPFDVQYQDLEEPTARGGKIPDLQGQRWGSTHIGAVYTSAADLRTVPDLGTFVSHVVRNPSVALHVAVPFEHRNWVTEAILRMAEPQTCHRIWVWPFRSRPNIRPRAQTARRVGTYTPAADSGMPAVFRRAPRDSAQPGVC